MLFTAEGAGPSCGQRENEVAQVALPERGQRKQGGTGSAPRAGEPRVPAGPARPGPSPSPSPLRLRRESPGRRRPPPRGTKAAARLSGRLRPRGTHRHSLRGTHACSRPPSISPSPKRWRALQRLPAASPPPGAADRSPGPRGGEAAAAARPRDSPPAGRRSGGGSGGAGGAGPGGGGPGWRRRLAAAHGPGGGWPGRGSAARPAAPCGGGEGGGRRERGGGGSAGPGGQAQTAGSPRFSRARGRAWHALLSLPFPSPPLPFPSPPARLGAPREGPRRVPAS